MFSLWCCLTCKSSVIVLLGVRFQTFWRNIVSLSLETSSPTRMNSQAVKLLDPEYEDTVIVRNARSCSSSDPASHRKRCKPLFTVWYFIPLLVFVYIHTHARTHAHTHTHIKVGITCLTYTLVYIFCAWFYPFSPANNKSTCQYCCLCQHHVTFTAVAGIYTDKGMK
jgi:hypothetical protein